MNFDSLILKTAALIFLLFLLSLAGAITFPAISIITTGAGLSELLLFIAIMIILSIIGNLIGRGIKTIKKPLEALVITFVGAFFMGATLVIFTVLDIPGTVRINLHWLGTSWYSSPLTFIFIGAPLMLVFVAIE